ncbi:hypothetical protein Mapa_000920 [Marchantia paleacea]|nr:hypothetical protein Mapa_000920 [Marchantia paleacea]
MHSKQGTGKNSHINMKVEMKSSKEIATIHEQMLLRTKITNGRANHSVACKRNNIHRKHTPSVHESPNVFSIL